MEDPEFAVMWLSMWLVLTLVGRIKTKLKKTRKIHKCICHWFYSDAPTFLEEKIIIFKNEVFVKYEFNS